MADIKEFLYRIQPSRKELLTEEATPEEKQLIGEHFLYLQDLTEKKVVVLAGRTLNTDPTSFGIVIFRAINLVEARKIMESDPAVMAGVFTAELFPFSTALIRE